MANETGLERLRENGVRFFVLGTEYDLWDEQARLFLAMNAVFNQFSARNQTRKSVENCIELAKRGIPSSGPLPFGRKYDREKLKWGINDEKEEMVTDVAKRYLAGESMAKLADEYGVNHSHLHKVMTQKCGGTHVIRFNPAGLKIDETIEMSMPRLLPKKTIKAIREKADANRTYRHGQYRSGENHPYLLTGMVFCAECSYSMFGQISGERRYYRHSQKDGSRQCPIKPRTFVPIYELEDAVFQQLFDVFGNPTPVRKAIEDAVPNRTKLAQYSKRQKAIEAELKKIDQGRERILTQITKDTITEEQTESKLRQLKDREQALHEEYEQLGEALVDLPSTLMIDEVVETISGHKLFYKASRQTSDGRKYNAGLSKKQIQLNNRYKMMSGADKRALAEKVFAGKRADGKPNGIYIQ